MDLDKIPAGRNPPYEVNVVIEVPLGGDPVKYELDKASGANAFDRLVLVAPPQTLGELRIALKKRTSARITAELAKNLTNVPIHDLPGHLDGVLAL